MQEAFSVKDKKLAMRGAGGGAQGNAAQGRGAQAAFPAQGLVR